MSYKGIDSIVESIKKDTQAAYNLEIEKANQKGEALYQEMMDEAKQRLIRIEKNQDEEVRHVYRREVKRFQLDAQKEIDKYKHELVDRVANESLQRLQNMKDEDFIATLNRVLERENGNEKPRICVDPKYYETVLASHGTEYQVLKIDEMSPGFLLRFKDYDVDCEFSYLFKYKRDTIVKLALIHLFGEGHE